MQFQVELAREEAKSKLAKPVGRVHDSICAPFSEILLKRTQNVTFKGLISWGFLEKKIN